MTPGSFTSKPKMGPQTPLAHRAVSNALDSNFGFVGHNKHTPPLGTAVCTPFIRLVFTSFWFLLLMAPCFTGIRYATANPSY
jgi:hypothetical protein